MTEQNVATFNLIDEPWIRVRTISGETIEMSLAGVFAHAHELVALANDIPTQDFAILRVLLAVLQRSVLPMAEDYEYPSDLWKDLWEAETLPVEEIDSYLQTWHSRFDLFDEKVPFMQVPNLTASNRQKSCLERIIGDASNGELFSMRGGRGLETLSYAEAARWLIHVHAFDTGGIKTGVEGDPDPKNGKGRSFGNDVGWAGKLGGVYLEGETLRHTLLLNLVLCEDVSGGDYYCFVSEQDKPCWELPPRHPGNNDRLPMGYADIYTWQSRSVRLYTNEGKATSVVLSGGDRVDAQTLYAIEPMSSWHLNRSKEKKSTLAAFKPTEHKADRAFWRGLTSVLPYRQDSQNLKTPGVVNWAGYLSDELLEERPILSEDYPLRIHAIGIEYKKGNGNPSAIVRTIDDDVIVNTFLLSPQGELARFVVKETMEHTEEAVLELRNLAKRLSLASGDDSERAASSQKAAVAEAYFELDGAYRMWLSSLGPDSNLVEERQSWYEQARFILLSMGRQMVDTVSPDAVVGRKVKSGSSKVWISATKAESQFRHWLGVRLPREDEKDAREDKEG